MNGPLHSGCKCDRETKIGLALSGGGFRASFFHIGVLGSLAAHGRLGQIDMISTVSGGSVIGVLYYLKVKERCQKQLQRQGIGAEISLSTDDYVEIVKSLEQEFTAGVQRNLRGRVYTNFRSNVRMNTKKYSRSDRMGELYDHYFYGNSGHKLRDLEVTDQRLIGRNQIPQLVINSTSLNTGHAWHFQPNTMGEPVDYDDFQDEFDKNLIMERPDNWSKLNNPHITSIPLGIAVAGSTCVPGLFPPLPISTMYDDYVDEERKSYPVRVRVVDGGIYDNLGIEGLITYGCNAFYISDASGQLGNLTDPAAGTLSVLGRINSILMDRLREDSLMRVKERCTKFYHYFHLRSGIQPDTVRLRDATTSTGRKGKIPDSAVALVPTEALTDFGVRRDIQDRLSHIRTDLDAFSDIEANALMLDAYLITEANLGAARPEKPDIQDILKNCAFAFKEYYQVLNSPSDRAIRCLSAGSKRLLKPMFIANWPSKIAMALILLLVIVLSAWGLFEFGCFLGPAILTIIGLVLLGLVAVYIVGSIPWIMQRLVTLQFLRYYLAPIVLFLLTTIGQSVLLIVGWINLYTLNKLFLWMGRKERVLNREVANG